MTFRPPHSEWDKLLASSKTAGRMVRENQEARRAYNRGKAFGDGRRSR